MESLGHAPLDLRVVYVVGRQRAADIELLNAAHVVVVQTAGGDSVVAEQEEHVAFGGRIEDGVLLALEMAVQHGRWIGGDHTVLGWSGLNSHGERREPLGVGEVEIVDPEVTPPGQGVLAALQDTRSHIAGCGVVIDVGGGHRSSMPTGGSLGQENGG